MVTPYGVQGYRVVYEVCGCFEDTDDRLGDFRPLDVSNSGEQ